MTRAHRCTAIALLLLLLFEALTSRAADFVNVVPSDALAFAAVRDIGNADQKIDRLLTSLKLPYGGPLEFLQLATGIKEGLDPKGDFLLFVLPGEKNTDRPELCVWLPVTDYERFVNALDGSPTELNAAITLGGEDLIVTRFGGWAVVMDPDQQERIRRMLENPAPQEQVLAWQEWIGANDISIVLQSSGMRSLQRWAAAASERTDAPGSEQVQDIFGPSLEPDTTQTRANDEQETSDFASQARELLRAALSSSPKLDEWVSETKAIGLGLRLDDHGNAQGGLRIAVERSLLQIDGASGDEQKSLASLSDGGDFVLSGAGELPPALSMAIAQVYTHLIVRDLKTQENVALDSDTLRRFQDAVAQAAKNVQSFAVLTKSGEQQEGVYTNNFLALRVPAADEFVDHVGEVMRLWNQMNREAERGTRLVFDVEAITVADRQSTLYSIDIAAADGAPELPEIRQAMEKLFGPGGKLQVLIVPVDEFTVLLAAATPQQAAGIVERPNQNEPVNWATGATAESNRLLPTKSDWRLFFSPHGYTTWHARQMEAITGPVLGGPIVKRFPPAPPIGAAGGLSDDGELWVDVVVPAQTIQSTPDYRKRPGVQYQR